MLNLHLFFHVYLSLLEERTFRTYYMFSSKCLTEQKRAREEAHAWGAQGLVVTRLCIILCTSTHYTDRQLHETPRTTRI